MKFFHKSGEGQGDDTLVIGTDPISNAVIHEPADDQGYLVVQDNLLMNEVIHTGVLELAHHSGGDVSIRQDQDFGRCALFDGICGSSVGGHCMKKTEGVGYKGDCLKTGCTDTYDNVLSTRRSGWRQLDTIAMHRKHCRTTEHWGGETLNVIGVMLA
jgi:hypothetical protein